jgi:hypothetical protein
MNGMIPDSAFSDPAFRNILDNFESSRTVRSYLISDHHFGSLVETKKIFQGLNAQQISKLIKGEYQDGIGSIIDGGVSGFDSFKMPDIYSVSTETTGHMFKFNVYMDLNDCYAKYINELNPDLRTPEMSKFLDLYQQQDKIGDVAHVASKSVIH